MQADATAAQPPLQCKECALGRLTLYGPTIIASPETLTRLRQEVRVVAPGRVFLRQGEQTNSISTIFSGWALQYQQLADGRRQIVRILIPGDLIAFENLCFPSYPVPFFVKSVTELSVCVFRLDDFVELVKTTDAQKIEFDLLRLDYVSKLHQRLMDIGRRSAIGRIARFLTELDDRLTTRGLVTNNSFEFPLRHQHLADALGLTPVHVSRTLGVLRKMELIDIRKQVMVIHNRNELLRISDEE